MRSSLPKLKQEMYLAVENIISLSLHWKQKSLVEYYDDILGSTATCTTLNVILILYFTDIRSTLSTSYMKYKYKQGNAAYNLSCLLMKENIGRKHLRMPN